MKIAFFTHTAVINNLLVKEGVLINNDVSYYSKEMICICSTVGLLPIESYTIMA